MGDVPLASEGDFYFNTKTGQVEQGKVSSWQDRMGPYRSREEAEHAFERAAQRNHAADEAEKDWRDDWEED